MAEFELKALITGVDKLSPALSRMQKKIRSFQRETEAAGRGGIAMAAALGAGLTASMVAYAKQEDAATGLKVAMMGANGQVSSTFEKINSLAIGLGNKLPGTTADFQNMMQMLVRQGIPAENILGGVGEASAYLAVQLKKTPEAAAEFAAKMQDATSTSAKDMMGLFDTIQKAFYLGVDDTNMLSFFTKTSSIIKMVNKDGLTAARALAPISVMMDQMGMQGESAGNALRKVVQAGLNMKKVGAANSLLKGAGLGIKLDFTDGKGGFGGLDNVFEQLQKLRGLSDVRRTRIITGIFGDDAETKMVVDALIDKGKQAYDEIQKKMEKQASLNQRVDAQLGTLTNLWEALTGTAVNGLSAIGDAFSDDAKNLVSWLGDMTEKFSDFAAKNPRFIRAAVGAAAGFVGLKLAFLGVSQALGMIGIGMKVSPLGAFLRIATIGVGYLVANWDKLGPSIMKIWDKVDGVAQGIGGWEPILEGVSALMVGAFATKTIGTLATAVGKAGALSNILTRISKMGAMTVTIGVALSMFNKLNELEDSGAKNGRSMAEEIIARNKAAQDARSEKYPGFFERANEIFGQIFGGNNITIPKTPASGQKGEVKVTFDNLPPGAQVTPVGQSMPWLNIDVGYNRFSGK